MGRKGNGNDGDPKIAGGSLVSTTVEYEASGVVQPRGCKVGALVDLGDDGKCFKTGESAWVEGGKCRVLDCVYHRRERI